MGDFKRIDPPEEETAFATAEPAPSGLVPRRRIDAGDGTFEIRPR
jgi:hypothetical protein